MREELACYYELRSPQQLIRNPFPSSSSFNYPLTNCLSKTSYQLMKCTDDFDIDLSPYYAMLLSFINH